MTVAERRRNMRAENCRACGKFCEAGQGYLYRDTNSRTVRRLGRFGWFVKCEECHGGNKSQTTVRMERDAAARADEPVVRPWSVSQVKRWTVSRTVHEGDVAIRISAGVFEEVVSYRDRINSRFTAPTGYALEQATFAGRPLSENAATHLSGQILPLVVAVQSEEQAAGEAAVAKLVAAGATATPCPSGYGWRVEYKGGRYTLWGCVDGKNKVSGLVGEAHQLNEHGGRWVETTAEELLGAS